MITVKLLGDAGRRYTRSIDLEVATPVEAVHALDVLFPGFCHYLTESGDRGVGWRVVSGAPEGIALEDLGLPVTRLLILAPIIEGRGDFGQIIAGVVLGAAGLLLAQPWLVNLGLSLVFSGIAGLLSPTPPIRKDAQRKTSYLFANTEYGTAQGLFVPLLYGEAMVYTPPVLSYGITVEPSDEYIFRKLDFCSTDGFELQVNARVVDCRVRLVPAAYGQVGSIFYNTPLAWTRSFSTAFNINIFGGSAADGFTIQWMSTKQTGGGGGNVGRVGGARLAFSGRTFNPYGDPFEVFKNGAGTTLASGLDFRANNWFWFDYDHGAGQFRIYWSYSSTKPDQPRFTTAWTFSDESLYMGISASTGLYDDNHDLISWEAKWT